MINCIKCKQELAKTNEYYICKQCGYKALISEDIVIFNPETVNDSEEYDSDSLNYLYKYEQKHFWFIHRKKVINEVFSKYANKNEEVIEIGAGTGDNARMLIANGYKNVSVGEMHINGLEYAKTYGINELYQFDILKSPFTEHFDLVCMFDVIEHIEKDDIALKNATNMLKKGGRIIITVPAHKWLWSNIDDNSRHKRRYSNYMMMELINNANLNLLYSSHFFSFILPLLFFRALTNKKKYDMENNEILAKKSGLTINVFANSILNIICKIEFVLLKLFHFKMGGSMIVVCEKL